MGSLVCKREFVIAGSGRSASVSLYAPERHADDEWRCKVEYRIGRKRARQTIIGVDGFQALQLALKCIRRRLDESELPLSWIGGENGDLGFPRMVPTALGHAFARRIDELIEREVAEHLAMIVPKDMLDQATERQRADRAAASLGRLARERG